MPVRGQPGPSTQQALYNGRGVAGRGGVVRVGMIKIITVIVTSSFYWAASRYEVLGQA